MKKFFVVLTAFVTLSLGLGGCKRVHVVETAYLVTHAGAHKGDTLIFHISSSHPGTSYVHFFLDSPCKKKDIPGTPENPPHCTVDKDVTGTTNAQYPFTVDSIPDAPPPIKPPSTTNPHPTTNPPPSGNQVQSACRGCCPMCQVVVINSHPVHTLVLSGTPPPPSQYPAVEILIDKDSDDNPIALTTTVYVGQPVTWYTSGTQAWSVNFATSPCALSEASPIGPKTQVYCTPQTSSGQPFAYSITVPGEKADGHGLLYVIPAPQAQ